MSFVNLKFEVNKVDHILEKFNISPFRFYLTGSRFFGNNKATSDWDFFVRNQVGIVEYLETLGFSMAPRHNYLDSNTVLVMRHSDGIDVQIVVEDDLKNNIQYIMKQNGIIPNKELKQESTNLWNAFFDVATGF